MPAVNRTPIVNFLVAGSAISLFLVWAWPYITLATGIGSIAIVTISRLFILICLCYLFRYGGLWKSRFITPMILLIVIGLFSGLFTIMHWRFGNFLTNTAALGVPGLYLIWFLRKTHKRTADILKLSWMMWFFGFWWINNFFPSTTGIYLQAAGYFFLLIVLWYTHRTLVADENVPLESWDFEKATAGPR